MPLRYTFDWFFKSQSIFSLSFFVDKEDDANEEAPDADGSGPDYTMIGTAIGGCCLCVALVLAMKIAYRVFFIGPIIMKLPAATEVFRIGIHFPRLT